MRILCTFPGKLGDVVWALPTLRCLAEAAGEPVTLEVAVSSKAVLTLDRPSYVSAWSANDDWETQDTAPISPRLPPWHATPGYDEVLHLGYEGWPTPTLAEDVYQRATQLWRKGLPALDLSRPWLTAASYEKGGTLVGFTDEWFELKLGLVALLDAEQRFPLLLVPAGSRWDREWGIRPTTLRGAAGQIVDADLLLADCSLLHVLGVALGTPVVVCEPNPQRHHPTFYPVGMDGPQVTVVRGGDGGPSFDARHCAETVQRVREQGRGGRR
jgi:hypothetical protein